MFPNWSVYAYCGNNPFSGKDPSGFSCVKEDIHWCLNFTDPESGLSGPNTGQTETLLCTPDDVGIESGANGVGYGTTQTPTDNVSSGNTPKYFKYLNETFGMANQFMDNCRSWNMSNFNSSYANSRYPLGKGGSSGDNTGGSGKSSTDWGLLYDVAGVVVQVGQFAAKNPKLITVFKGLGLLGNTGSLFISSINYYQAKTAKDQFMSMVDLEFGVVGFLGVPGLVTSLGYIYLGRPFVGSYYDYMEENKKLFNDLIIWDPVHQFR
jgi:hypothetical protein